MLIRKAKQKDLKFIEEIEFLSAYHKKRFDFFPILKKLFDKKEFILVAEKNKKIVGYIVLTKKGEIGFFAVEKKFQGKGIGTNLLKKCFDIAKKKKLKKVFLDVRGSNKKAINLYKKFGFSVIKKYYQKIGKKNILKLRMKKAI